MTTPYPDDKAASSFAAPIGSETPTCAKCGAAMVYNVPRLGPSGGFVHASTYTLLCPCPKCGSGRRTALQTHCAECFSEFPNHDSATSGERIRRRQTNDVNMGKGSRKSTTPPDSPPATGYGAAQLIDIFCELQRNVDNAVCALKCADFGYAEVQLRVAHEKAKLLRDEKERHTEKLTHGPNNQKL